MISELYKLLVTFSTDSSAAKLNAWRSDLQEELTMEQWSKACKLAQTQTGNTRLKMLQLNWLMRVHITPEKLTSVIDVEKIRAHCSTVYGYVQK